MERRIAIIDLGSNTCRLVIFAFSPQLSFKLIDQVSERLRVGEGMFAPDAHNRLQPEPMGRAVQLLKMYRELCDANSIERVLATATSAVRDAANQSEFLELVLRESGLRLRVLSGDEEAYYAYLGVINSLPFTDGIVADLGGGSLELVRVRSRLPVAFASLPLGAVRLTEQFVHGDAITKHDSHALSAHIDQQLAQVKWLSDEQNHQLVALGGTMRALAKLDQRRRSYPLDRLHGYTMSRTDVRELATELTEKRLAERQKIKGLDAERADVIPAGATVIWRLMKYLDVTEVTVSGQGLREGLFDEAFLRDLTHQPGTQPMPLTQIHLPANISRISLIPDVRAFGIANISYLYQIDWLHASQVCSLALNLFHQLRELHHYGVSERRLLATAAILHDVGVVIDYYRHHRHSAYLIENADLPGFSHREIAMIALLVRWHRHGTPTLDPYAQLLDRTDLARVQKLSALLRVAEDLERSRAQAVLNLRGRVTDHAIEIEALTRRTVEAELLAANRNSDIFESIFGRALKVKAIQAQTTLPRPAEDIPPNILERAQDLAERFSTGNSA